MHDKFNLIQVRGYSRKYEHACGTTKKWQERSVKGHNYKFLPQNKLFHFSKRDLHPDTARNKWLKKALQVIKY